MSNFQNDAKQALVDTKTAVVQERRRLVGRLITWLRDHPHTVIVIVAAAVILGVTFGLLKG
jgi:ElaB/YqjD/DUF883 family membrane-anchored ribosome-binding protein